MVSSIENTANTVRGFYHGTHRLSRTILREQMEEFFFGADAKMPEGWSPEGVGAGTGGGGDSSKGGGAPSSKGGGAPSSKGGGGAAPRK
ncbi:MAG: hypothetical protein NVSMB38_45040 [Ktedonobacteraceae bacterium]